MYGIIATIVSQLLRPAFCILLRETNTVKAIRTITQIILPNSQNTPTWFILLASMIDPNPITQTISIKLQSKKPDLFKVREKGFMV